MSDFKAILLEGLFHGSASGLQVEQDDGVHVSVSDTLHTLVGQRIQFALHHLPPGAVVQPDLPGAGSCRFPGGKGCPVGHDIHPDRLLSFHMDGVLRQNPWALQRFDGSVFVIPWQGMVGHFGRLAVATIVDIEKMRDSLAGMDPASFTSAGLGSQDLEKILGKLRKAMGN